MDPAIATAVGLFITLDRAWRQPFKVGSRFSREGSLLIAIAASEGWITNSVGQGEWGERWLITELGQEMKGQLDEILQEQFTDITD